MPRSKARNWHAVAAHHRRSWVQNSAKAIRSRQACREPVDLSEELDAVDQDDPCQDVYDQDD